MPTISNYLQIATFKGPPGLFCVYIQDHVSKKCQQLINVMDLY